MSTKLGQAHSKADLHKEVDGWGTDEDARLDDLEPCVASDQAQALLRKPWNRCCLGAVARIGP